MFSIFTPRNKEKAVSHVTEQYHYGKYFKYYINQTIVISALNKITGNKKATYNSQTNCSNYLSAGTLPHKDRNKAKKMMVIYNIKCHSVKHEGVGKELLGKYSKCQNGTIKRRLYKIKQTGKSKTTKQGSLTDRPIGNIITSRVTHFSKIYPESKKILFKTAREVCLLYTSPSPRDS